MRISIKYEASWRNSFLDGSNNEPLPKNGRGFIGSMTTLGKKNSEGTYSNFVRRSISHDTVMGVLNRLIGDQRKLYQSRQSPDYFFKQIESKVAFTDRQDLDKPLNSEMIFIRNITGSTDQSSFTGMVVANDPVFISDFSNAFWGVLTLDLNDLATLLNQEDYMVKSEQIFDPFIVLRYLEELNKLKPVDIETIMPAFQALKRIFPDVNYKTNDEKIKPIEIYCSALYLQIARLKTRGFDITPALTKNGGIAGISKRGFTPKDFMDRYTTGSKKKIWGNPYLLKERRKGEGEVVSMLTKASGTLDITLDISDEKAVELQEMINAAGVSSFYLGKKGLAYVDVIR
jgi:hypothetical protein